MVQDAINAAEENTQQGKLLKFQRAFPPNARVDVKRDDPEATFGGRIVGKGRIDTTGKAIFQVHYDEGNGKYWHEVDTTIVTKPFVKSKTLVVAGEKVTELMDADQLTDERDDLVSGDVTVACLVAQLTKSTTRNFSLRF